MNRSTFLGIILSPVLAPSLPSPKFKGKIIDSKIIYINGGRQFKITFPDKFYNKDLFNLPVCPLNQEYNLKKMKS